MRRGNASKWWGSTLHVTVKLALMPKIYAVP